MLTIGNAVAATRVVVHGPPPATPDSAEISKAAMTKLIIALNLLHWRPGETSNTWMKVESQSWLGIGNHVSHD